MAMEQSTWFFVGAFAFLSTAASILMRDRNIAVQFLAGGVGTLLWIVWSINAFAVEVDSGAVVRQYSHTSLGVIGALLAIVVGLDLLAGVIAALRGSQDTTQIPAD